MSSNDKQNRAYAAVVGKGQTIENVASAGEWDPLTRTAPSHHIGRNGLTVKSGTRY